jgi:phosphatidylglycerol:prolipoprotein diacylglycerol transferase
LGRKLIGHLRDGDILFGYLIWYSFGRFFLEMLRIDPWVIGGIATAQWISALAIVVSLTAMTYGRYRLRHTP